MLAFEGCTKLSSHRMMEQQLVDVPSDMQQAYGI